MQVPPSFPTLLATAAAEARRLEQAAVLRRSDEDGVLSLALPLAVGEAGLDPLALLPQLGSGQERAAGSGHDGFRFLWDSAPGLCLAASGCCNRLELSGPRRFELAQRFSSASLGRLASGPDPCPPLARPRVLLAFSFHDAPLQPGGGPPGVQVVLPRWQLSRQGRQAWLRLQRVLGGGITPRQLAEELWETARHLERCAAEGGGLPAAVAGRGVASGSSWQGQYRAALERALELVDGGELQKLVLAVRQQLRLEEPLDPLQLLDHLRRSQPGSCRFLWQQDASDVLLGASPERLLTVRQGQLLSDALAGTAPDGEAGALLLSAKDRHEHELVAATITSVLQRAGLNPRRPRHPRLARHGSLVHLHTPITAALEGQQPLALAEVLHPTPAVAGLPRREAMAWLRTLEPFERGHYAAPIGWIDSQGDADLRVAIRSGRLRGNNLELTAGAGLVRGSRPERELQEVALKLGVLQQQLNLPAPPAARRTESRGPAR